VASVILLNGKLVDDACISVSSRAFQYGDGVFETIRVVLGKTPLLARHIDRLVAAASKLNLVFDEHQFMLHMAQLKELWGENEPVNGTLKIVLSRATGGRGCYTHNITRTETLIHFSQNTDLEGWMQPAVQLKVAEGRLTCNASLAELKHLNRLDYIVAAGNCVVNHNEELLFLNTADHVVECMHHNVFWLKDGGLYTASVSTSGVAGVMRNLIITFCEEQLGTSVQVGEYSLSELIDADEIFLTNALRGVVPVAMLESSHYIDFSFAQMVAECLPYGTLPE